jgi:DNA modification methylase
MTKINLSEDDLQKLSECINNQTEIPEDLLVKLSPGFFEKLQREGQFDYQKLNKFKIPTIEYAGKRPESVILAQAAITGGAAPLQIVRSFGETEDNEWRNMIIQGDNLQFLKTCYLNQDPLIKDKVKGKVKLIYIDPPFGTKSDFMGENGESSYSDKVERAEFLESLRESLLFARNLLAIDGSIYIHLDQRLSHYVKIILDEIFDKANFRNEIIWKRSQNVSSISNIFRRSHDTILYYIVSSRASLNRLYKSQDEKYLSQYKFKDHRGVYRHAPLLVSGKRTGETGSSWRGINPNKLGRNGMHWITIHEKLENLDKNGLVYWPSRKGQPMLKYFLDKTKGAQVSDVWDDINLISPTSEESLSYPTQKPEALLERIIKGSSNENDLILDCFAGSGTTAAVAEKLGRRWIMCDFGKHAIYTMQKRIWNIAASKKLGQGAKKNEKYGQSPQPFSIISAGAYDFTRIMNLRKNKDAYINFVLGLFGIARDEKEYSLKYKLSNICAEKDNNPVEVYPIWQDDYLRDVKIDEDYLKEIIVATGGRLKGDYYIVTPESCTIITDTTLKNSNNEDVNFKLLKFPYKVLEDISRHLQIEEQPSSQEDINKLISSTTFYFNEDIKIEVERLSGGFKIKQFKTEILDKSKKRFEGLEGLSMLLIDRNYNGQIFNMNLAIYRKEINDKVIVKVEDLDENSYLIAIDKHGNESKITKI